MLHEKLALAINDLICEVRTLPVQFYRGKQPEGKINYSVVFYIS